MARRLNENMITTLNELADVDGSWWNRLVEDRHVFMALRDGYLNAYVNGASIAKVGWRAGRLTCNIHVEYLTLPASRKHCYFDLNDEAKGITPRKMVFCLDEYAKKLGTIKRRTRNFKDDERADENTIARGLRGVLDIELAYNQQQAAEQADENPEFVATRREQNIGRIDMVVARTDGRLVFVEIKRFENAELRAQMTPKVCDQLMDYHQQLKKRRAFLANAYGQTIRSMQDLKGRFFSERELPRPESLHVDPIPRLLIVGYDGEQAKAADLDGKRIAALMREECGLACFSDEHVIHKGSAGSVTMKDFDAAT